MAFIPVANTCGVVVAGEIAEQRIINTFYLRKGSSWDLATLQLAAELCRNWHISFADVLLSQNYALTQVIATSLQSASAPQYILDIDPPNPGQDTRPTIPAGSALVVTFRTALRGRSYRGRHYRSGIPNGVVDNGRWNGPYLQSWITAYEEFLADVLASGWEWVVVSRQQGGVPLTAGITTAITTVTADDAPDSQRRRNPGRGE